MNAANYGYRDGVQALLNSNAEFNIQDSYRSTALHFAIKEGHLSIIELLVTACASASPVDDGSQTALNQDLNGTHYNV